ncbi:MAG TPA: hypothetical protein VFK16_05120 [Gemmatimonadaceae bacterium]|nr:hypothetical protein [Gemmatimonadaceae bacterium]
MKNSDIATRLARYTPVKLQADTSALSPAQRKVLPLLVEAAKQMNPIYWREAYGNGDSLLASITDPKVREYVRINFGPWDRIDNFASFVPGVGPRPAGANYYPRDMTRAEFDSAVAGGGAHADSLKSQYTMVRRDESGHLTAIPYHEFFKAHHDSAAACLDEAARLAQDPGFRHYLTLRAQALRTDDYRPSDLAWMDMKTNTLELVIGPIETYEDALFGYKTAHEAFVLIKDKAWSQRLARYSAMLPALQRGLPVPEAYKRETPGSSGDLNAYDVAFVAGQANVGSKTIAINLPNDETVQLEKGTRRLQLKNAMRAKFDKIVMPVAGALIDSAQLGHVSFDAFFEDVMFHEVAHGLGIKHTVNGKGLVRTALKERASALEEGKADILGLYMIRQLNGQGELGQEDIADNYVTFLASLLRSVRFGASDAHGRANIVAFNFLKELGAFTRDAATGRYHVELDRFRAGTDSLARTILTLQGDGDYAGVGALNAKYGTIGAELQGDLDRLQARGIPVDIIYDQ